MIFNLGFLLGIILYSIYSYFKGTSKMILHFFVSIISLIIAVVLNDIVASLLSKYVSFLDLDTSMDIILGSEYVYYKTIAFLLVYLPFSIIISIILGKFYKNDRFEFDSKLAKFNIGVFVGLFQMIILLSIALSTPYAIDYSNKLSTSVSNTVGVGTLMNKISYDYTEYNQILSDNPNLPADEINIIVFEEMINDNYTSKKKLKNVLKDSYWYNDEIDEWLSE
ncbi:MAG: hypothetical protein ACK5K7_02960 [Bacilli bacterium]